MNRLFKLVICTFLAIFCLKLDFLFKHFHFEITISEKMNFSKKVKIVAYIPRQNAHKQKKKLIKLARFE